MLPKEVEVSVAVLCRNLHILGAFSWVCVDQKVVVGRDIKYFLGTNQSACQRICETNFTWCLSVDVHVNDICYLQDQVYPESMFSVNTNFVTCYLSMHTSV